MPWFYIKESVVMTKTSCKCYNLSFVQKGLQNSNPIHCLVVPCVVFMVLWWKRDLLNVWKLCFVWFVMKRSFYWKTRVYDDVVMFKVVDMLRKELSCDNV